MTTENPQDIMEPVREAASRDDDLRSKVRQLVTDAILKREADPKAIRSVMQAAVEGLGTGLAQRAGQTGEALKEAVGGLDQAIAKSTYAMRMAIEEAAGQGRQFSEQDLTEALESLRRMEADLMDLLKQTGDKTQGTLKSEFEHLREHLTRNGTDTGVQVRDMLAVLKGKLAIAGAGAVGEAGQTALEARGRLAAVSSGILRGLADVIDAKTR
ncbi:MAG: hypothetical protein HY850_04845 [Betaproteobacteria bacterium]|nr:hypothetical protein [Betaproteobacteria bacterium]